MNFKKSIFKKNRYISKRLFPALFMLFLSLQGHAQTPQSGIYRLAKPDVNYFNSAYYASYIHRPNKFYTVDIIPDKQVQKYGLAYALVSVDSAAKKVKIAILRDTVSTAGKKKLRQLKEHQSVFFGSGGPHFVSEFRILGDSIAAKPTMGQGLSFPGRGNIDGQWIFSRHANNYPHFAIIKYPKSRQISRYDSTTGDTQWGTQYTFQQSFFTNYHTKRVYQDLRYTFNHDSIAVYAAPKNGADVQTYFKNKEYMAVRKDSADWMAVDHVLIKPDNKRYVTLDAGTIQGTTKLKIFSGWVKKEDLVADPWVKQKQQTKDFRFEVSGRANEDDDYINRGQVEAIKIINKKTGKQQLILDIGAPLNNALDNVIQVQDSNFDGYPDIDIFGHTGGAGPNDGYNFYLYNPQNGRFEYNEALSDLTQVVVDTQNKIITSAFRDGCCHHGGETYTFKNGTLDTLAYWDQSYRGGFFAQNISDTLVAGKWKSTSYRSGSVIAKKALVFAEPNEKQTATDTLSENDMTNIRKKTPLWFYVNATKYDSKNYKMLGNVSGWIRKQTMLPQKWKKQAVRTKRYRFETTGDNALAAIKIVQKKDGAPLLIITDMARGHASSDSLQSADYNFDGHADFRLQSWRSNKKKFYHDYYLFDPADHLFKADTTLSKLPNLRFDPQKNIIKSISVDKDDTNKQVRQYQWINGHLESVDQVNQ